MASVPNTPEVSQPAKAKILAVDDEPDILDICCRVADELGFESFRASRTDEALRILEQEPMDVVLTDVRMPGKDGFALFRNIRSQFPDTIVLMMTAYGTIDQAVAAMKSGIFDYIPKPFDIVQLRKILSEAAAWRLRDTVCAVPGGGLPEEASFHGIVGQSAPMQEVFERILRAAQVDSTVLIQGESGTGKELVAHAIHAAGPRAMEPFLPVACNALTETLVESELFGHTKGAFTGADHASLGILRAAGHGTVFLDEIGEVPPNVQAKFLRALQEREIRPVGGMQAEFFEARVITATNRNLAERVAEGSFRRDLFYRLHVVPVHLPPLRDRREDIPLLVEHFLDHLAKSSKERKDIENEAINLLTAQDWPGNVRQLENIIEQACVMTTKNTITADLMRNLLAPRPSSWSARPKTADAIRSIADHEEEAVRDALRKTGNNKTAAARALGITAPTLYAKMRKYGIANTH